MATTTYVINLDRSTARMAFMEDQLEEHGLEFQRVAAVDGNELSATDLRHVSVGCRVTCTSSMIGCGLSHRKVWRDVLRKDLSHALVLEDDAVLTPDFGTRLHEALEAVPEDFDILLLGCFFLCDARREYPLHLRSVKPFMTLRKEETTWVSGQTTVYVPEMFGGTHCYVVSAKGARQLLTLIPKVGYHVDMEMNHPLLRVYAASPALARQRDMAASTIANFDFPKLLNPFLGAQDGGGVSLAYYMSAPAGEVLGLRVNAWALIFLCAGLLLPRSAWRVVAWYLGAEAVLAGSPRGVALPALAYLCGTTARQRYFVT